jgi:hypothetical protein
MRPLLTALLALVFGAASAAAADYAKIDRRLTKEPAYRSKAPKYALLLFGRNATVRVWVVVDGEAVYLNRNGDGDLTRKDERFQKHADCKDITIADPDGKRRYVITGVSVLQLDPPAVQLMVEVKVQGDVNYEQYSDTTLEASPRQAAVAHFHGPLTIGPPTVGWKVSPALALTAGKEPNDMRAVVGTLSAEYGCWVVVRTHQKDAATFPKGVCPVVDIEFPPKAPGAPAVKKRYTLDGFC